MIHAHSTAAAASSTRRTSTALSRGLLSGSLKCRERAYRLDGPCLGSGRFLTARAHPDIQPGDACVALEVAYRGEDPTGQPGLFVELAACSLMRCFAGVDPPLWVAPHISAVVIRWFADSHVASLVDKHDSRLVIRTGRCEGGLVQVVSVGLGLSASRRPRPAAARRSIVETDDFGDVLGWLRRVRCVELDRPRTSSSISSW